MAYYDVFTQFIGHWFPAGTLPEGFVAWLVGLLAISVMYLFTGLLLGTFTVKRKTLLIVYVVIVIVYSLQYIVPMIPVDHIVGV